MIVSVLTPSRGRPHHLAAHARSVHSSMSLNVSVARAEVLACVDDDDPCLADYERNGSYALTVRPRTWGPGESQLGRAWNMLAYIASGEFLMMGNDDLEFLPGWDVALRAAATRLPADGIACYWGDDGINGPNHCAFPIVTRRWYELLGRFTPECFRFFRHDTWIFDVAQRVGRAFFVPELRLKHRHHTTDGGVYDQVTVQNRNASQGEVDAIEWDRTVLDRAREAEYIRKALS